MNLYFRLIRVLICAFSSIRGQSASIDFPNGVSKLTFRAWPFDCDLNFHMNQARYSNLTDLARFDMIIRMGLGSLVKQRKLSPIVLGINMEYKKEIRPFEAFTIESRAFSWEKNITGIEHLFFVQRHGEKVLAAKGLAKVSLYDRKQRAFAQPEEYAAHLGQPTPEVIMSATEADFMKLRLINKEPNS